jgi:hypothetical protein
MFPDLSRQAGLPRRSLMGDPVSSHPRVIEYASHAADASLASARASGKTIGNIRVVSRLA